MSTAPVAPTQAPDQTELRICRACGGDPRPLSEFVRSQKSPSGRLWTCRACLNAKRRGEHARRVEAGGISTSQGRQQRADRRKQLGAKFVEQAPSPAPARLLGELMIYDRAYGLEFDAVWAENVDLVVNAIHTKGVKAERDEWAACFAATKAGWEAAWERRPGKGDGLTRALLDGLSEGFGAA
jgi:hypothetical protein